MIGQRWEAGHGNARGVNYPGKVRHIADGVVMYDNSDMIKKAVAASIRSAAAAVGVEAVGLVKRQMLEGYKDPHPNRDQAGHVVGGTHTEIRDTSAMIDSIAYESEDGLSQHTLTVGTNSTYAMFVHEGTRFLKGRPFITDAIAQGWDRLLSIWADYINREL